MDCLTIEIYMILLINTFRDRRINLQNIFLTFLFYKFIYYMKTHTCVCIERDKKFIASQI